MRATGRTSLGPTQCPGRTEIGCLQREGIFVQTVSLSNQLCDFSGAVEDMAAQRGAPQPRNWMRPHSSGDGESLFAAMHSGDGFRSRASMVRGRVFDAAGCGRATSPDANLRSGAVSALQTEADVELPIAGGRRPTSWRVLRVMPVAMKNRTTVRAEAEAAERGDELRGLRDEAGDAAGQHGCENRSRG